MKGLKSHARLINGSVLITTQINALRCPSSPHVKNVMRTLAGQPSPLTLSSQEAHGEFQPNFPSPKVCCFCNNFC